MEQQVMHNIFSFNGISLPFKGRVGVGMGLANCYHIPHPPPDLPLEGGGKSG
jgi:hypothetical protein